VTSANETISTNETTNHTQTDVPTDTPANSGNGSHHESNGELTRKPGANTLSVHGGDDRARAHQSVPMPIIQTATYAFADTADLINFMQHKSWGDGIHGREEYGRYGNPTVHSVERKVAALEGAGDAVLFSSGMAAITSLLLASLPTGSHIVMTSDCYRRTRQFCTVFLKRLGIETSIVETGDYEALEAAIQPKRTRFLISESPTNPYLRCVDLERIAKIAKAHRVQTIIDSTFGTSINQRPLDYGIDYVVHSATKYMGGHHDLLAGVVAGRKDRIAALRDARGVLGGIVDPQGAYLLERGLKTLGLRVQQQNATTLKIAQFLEAHPVIERVWYPGLPSHPDHEIASKQMIGFGGVVSFEVRGDLESTSRFIDALEIPYIAPSLGGVDSLIEQPALMSFFEKTTEERLELGIRDNLVRFAVGVEDADDLIADLDQALKILA
jgi:cystathionine gamma-synthase